MLKYVRVSMTWKFYMWFKNDVYIVKFMVWVLFKDIDYYATFWQVYPKF